MINLEEIARSLREEARRHRRHAATIEEQVRYIEGVIAAAKDAQKGLGRQETIDALVGAILNDTERDDD